MADITSPFTPNMQQQLEALLQMSGQRVADEQPIHQAAMAMAARMAPGYARGAMTATPTMPALSAAPAATSGSQSSSGGFPVGKTLALSGLGALLTPGKDGEIPLKKLIDGLKKLFSHGPSVQGNKPFSGGAATGGGQGYPDFTGWDQSVSDPFGNPLLPSDPGFWTNWDGNPNDPSGGTGVGPGMQDYYSGGGSDNMGDNGPDDDWWHP